jgi:hypothetical protein
MFRNLLNYALEALENTGRGNILLQFLRFVLCDKSDRKQLTSIHHGKKYSAALIALEGCLVDQ